MERTVFKAKVDWWIYLVMVIAVGGCLIGPAIDGDWLIGIIMGLSFLFLAVFTIAGVKYEIRDGKLGIRRFFHWSWIPIDKISSARIAHGITVTGPLSASLSLHRVTITLSDRSILKSSMPVEISPVDPQLFIASLQKINPLIQS